MVTQTQAVIAAASHLVFAVFATFASAETPAPMVQLGDRARELKVGASLDARGIQLRGTTLIGQDLRNANFSNCDLAGVQLESCILSAANFRGASLRHAFIHDCDVSGADFTDAIVNELGGGSQSRGVLSDTQLRTTKSFKDGDLSHCDIQLAPGSTMDFRGMDLRGAAFRRGDYSKSKFEGADLMEVYFGRCRFSFTELRKAKRLVLQNCAIHARFVDAADFSNRDLSRSKISWIAPSVKMDGADISSCRLTGTAIPLNELQKTKSFRMGNLAGVTFLKMSLTGLDLSRQNLTGSNFTFTVVKNVNFTDAVITGAGFGSAEGLTAEQIRSTWNFKHDRMQSVTLSPELQSELKVN